MGRNAQDMFVTQLVKTRRTRVVQANLVLRTLKRRGLRWTGVVDPRLLRAAKKWLKADYVLTGKLRWGGDGFVLSTHAMDVKTLETTIAEDTDFRRPSQMRVAVRNAAKKVANALSGGHSHEGKTALFLKVNPRAFYDTAERCNRRLVALLQRQRFDGRVEDSSESKKLIRVAARGSSYLAGMPVDIYSGDDDIDGPQKLLVGYYRRLRAGKHEIVIKALPDSGIALNAKVSNSEHKWVIAFGNITDEAEDDRQLVGRLRDTILERMSEQPLLTPAEDSRSRLLASLSRRRLRKAAFERLFRRGVEVAVEGRLYGSRGNRRADLRVFFTMTGKLVGHLRFETGI